MKIAVGSDHAGFEPPPPLYKPAIVEHLKARGHEVVDCGPEGPEAVDYPDYAGHVCRALLAHEAEMGVLLCGTGVGMSMAANRFKGIRAAVCTNTETARITREHNDANIVAVGRRLSSLAECLAIIDAFLETPFSGADRHARRVNKIDCVTPD